MIAVILLIAALVMPNVVSMKNSREERSLWASLQRLPQRAREEAIARRNTVTLRPGDTTSTLEIVETTTDQDNRTSDTVIETVDLGDTASVGSAYVHGQNVQFSEFALKFYPDGSAERGGLTVTIGDLTRSLVIDIHGRSSLNDGAYPEEDPESWPAGETEQRA